MRQRSEQNGRHRAPASQRTGRPQLGQGTDLGAVSVTARTA